MVSTQGQAYDDVSLDIRRAHILAWAASGSEEAVSLPSRRSQVRILPGRPLLLPRSSD
jgi:hypothetical protein